MSVSWIMGEWEKRYREQVHRLADRCQDVYFERGGTSQELEAHALELAETRQV
jgi:hypothetical protein